MWLKALVLLTLIGYVAAQCNVCQSASNVACHSETTFSICYDGVPSYDLLPCPKDFYCTDGFYTCYENADPVCQTENDSTTTEIQTTTTTAIPTTTTTTEIPTTTVTTEIPTTTITTEIPTTTVTTEIPTTTPTTTTTTEIPNTTTTTEIPTTTPTSTTTTEIPTTTTTTEIPTTTTTTEIPTTTPTTTTTTEIPTTTTTTETPTTTSTEAPWDADDICQQYSKNTFFENVDDPTCTTFITCTVDADGTHSTKVTSCKANQYFSTSLKVCTATRPDGCVEETTTVDTTTPTTTTVITTTPTTTTTVSTTTPTTTTVTTTTASTTTAEPWSAEATCLTVTKTTLFQNQDDPTCTTYLYCYVVNGSATALIKNCKTNQYYDVSLKTCTATKPDYCT
ncbi:integumentary mucin C.1 isoform X2 [Drosophila yakuba]|uniref:integumentary mucin C.1 isoform X2 n=1 Tax=Drosophila yakuba TaxID=7245 RepID=UPI0019307A24|nr:integumentary mucin C.1 isoform X2 [Drosophila yakuba]